MYARVTTIQFQQGRFEEGMQIARESVEPAVRQQSGLKSFLALQVRLRFSHFCGMVKA